MNIFETLKYYSNLSENFTSSFIKYLLKPDENHGLGYCFFKSILPLFDDEIKFSQIINKKTDLIIPSNEKSLDPFGAIEIGIEFSYREPSKKSAQKGVVLIENKINEYSIQNKDKDGNKQLKRYLDYLGSIKADYKKLIYLLPEHTDLDFLTEYYYDILSGHPEKGSLLFLYWKHPLKTPDAAIYKEYIKKRVGFIDVFKEILKNEADASLQPLDPNLIYLIKSFIHLVNNNFSFEDTDDSFIQRYDDFKKSIELTDGKLMAKFNEFERLVKTQTGRSVNDSMSLRSVKVGIPTPSRYYKKEYKNPQFIILVKEILKRNDKYCFSILFEGAYYSSRHWKLDELKEYFEKLKIEFSHNPNSNTLTVYIFDNTEIAPVADFEVLKQYRADT